jgi:hypothetical protein
MCRYQGLATDAALQHYILRVQLVGSISFVTILCFPRVCSLSPIILIVVVRRFYCRAATAVYTQRFSAHSLQSLALPFVS